jgi:hypothetical protein
MGIVIGVVEEEEAMRVRGGWRRAANEGKGSRPHGRGRKRNRMLLGEKATTTVVATTTRRRRKAALRPSPGIHCLGFPVVLCVHVMLREMGE